MGKFKNNEDLKTDFLRELLRTGSISESAKRCDVSRTAIYNCMNSDREFRRNVSSVRQQYSVDLLDACRRYSPVALDVLVDILLDKNSPTTSRVTACCKILDLGISLEDKISQDEELLELTAQVQQLEMISSVSNEVL